MHALKIEDLKMPKRRADAIVNALRDFAQKLGFNKERIEALECRSRDGFCPYSHNKGGIECNAYQDQNTAYSEGTGFENADATLEKYYQIDVERFAEDNGLKKDVSDWNEENQDAFRDMLDNDYESTVLYSMDAMLTGENEVNLRLCVCVKDAPYHRKYDDLIELDIKFKDLKDLRLKLDKALKNKAIKKFSGCLDNAF